MPSVIPAFATVRPRVTRRGDRDARPIEDVVAELVEELPHGLIEIAGPSGSGKSTAAAHLAAALGGDERLVFLDEPTPAEFDAAEGRIVIAADLPAGVERSGIELKLAAWGGDELVEYLLAVRPDACASVMARMGDAARRTWSPQLAVIVLDRFAANSAANDPVAELCSHTRERFLIPAQWHAACQFCLALLAFTPAALKDAIELMDAVQCPDEVRSLLRHEMIQTPLAVESLLAELGRGSTASLERRLPESLVELAGRRCRSERRAKATLKRSLRPTEHPTTQAMAASLLYATVPQRQWRPPARREPWQLAGGYFASAPWGGIVLAKAGLCGAGLQHAELTGACLQEAQLQRARLDGATLNDANMNGIDAVGVNLTGAALPRAKLAQACLDQSLLVETDFTEAALMNARLAFADLTSARLIKADLTGASLGNATLEDADCTGAILRNANLSGVDLRTARLDGACLDGATLAGAQLEDIRWPDARLQGAKLHGAHLTGSSMRRGDFRNAIFAGAGLAEVDWEDADLRGADLRRATFHMGSSRSGLVGSPIACEGSKTGFYTDDFEDMNFKRPEEIRKANLCGADLRGANIDGLDFYLVDLRDAKLDPPQLEHVRRCGAILGKAVA